jgi:hypothetical protein
MGAVLDREEYIEQAYFFHHLRERLASNMATQEILQHIHEEILSTTRLPLAIQFLATEMKHSGLLSSGFARLAHYFAPFQAFVVRQTEDDKRRFHTETAFLILEREAQYRADKPTPAGLFVYQFETLSRNRLGYDEGLMSMRADPFYPEEWRLYIDMVHQQIGIIDFADLVYVRSEFYVAEQRRLNAGYEPPLPPLLGEKEGKIAKANRGRDPLYLFAALQRQLGYPEVPKPVPRDDLTTRVEALKAKVREQETRLKLVEMEQKNIDMTKFLQNPELLSRRPPDEIP